MRRFWIAGKVGMALSIAILGISGVTAVCAQGPEDGPCGPLGIGPHRPPIERAMGPGGPRGARGRWWNEPHAIKKLKLTDAQRKSMDDIYQKQRLTLVDLHASLEKQELVMEPLIRAD